MKPPFTSHQQLREHYQAEMAAMRQSFDRTGNGVLCIRRRALVVDSLLEPLWQFESGSGLPAGFALVAPALVAVGAVDAGTADQIRADLELAVAVRQPGQENQARLMRGFSGRAGTTVALDQALSTGHARSAPHRALCGD